MKHVILILLVYSFLISSCKKEELYSSTISVEGIACLKQKIVDPGQRNVLLYELKVTSPVTINLSEVKLSVQSGTSFQYNVDLWIVIDDIARDVQIYRKNSVVSFSLDNIIIKPSQDCRIKIFADISNIVSKGESIFLTLYKLHINDILSGTIITSYDKPIGEVLTIQ